MKDKMIGAIVISALVIILALVVVFVPNNSQDAKQELSEYDLCMKEALEQQDKIDECTQDTLKEQGYDDGINCVQDFNINEMEFNTSLCEDSDRYSAEVNAYNDCLENNSYNRTIADCYALM